LDSLESEGGNWQNLVGTRIASTSKIYAMYSPRLWSMYDSRVGKGIQTIISRYDVLETTSEYLDFPCPPGRNRGPIDGFRAVGTKRQAILGFLYGSWLFRVIANKLKGRT